MRRETAVILDADAMRIKCLTKNVKINIIAIQNISIQINNPDSQGGEMRLYMKNVLYVDCTAAPEA
jgi:hypothetical protein